MRILIAPSILSANFSQLAKAVEISEIAGADLIHIDIMDGHFVPDITFGPKLIKDLKKITRLPLDVHLMVERPEHFINLFAEAGADWISVHPEVTPHLHRHIKLIHNYGCRAGAALNPATPLCILDEVLTELDYILLMSVNPGWGGQSFIPSSREKIARLRSILNDRKLTLDIEVDGGVKHDNVADLIASGLTVVVAGSAVFDAPDPGEAIRKFKEIAQSVKGLKK